MLPEDMLPYRSIGVEAFEQWLQRHYQGRDPPPASEVEKECMQRALKRFEVRIPSLTSWLGQMIPIIKPSAPALWQSLGKLGRLGAILEMLSDRFKISLLADYSCLRPWSAPTFVRGTGS